MFDDPPQPPNSARFVFLNPRAPEFFVDWDTIAHDAVAILRAEAGRDPHDRRLSDLIGELPPAARSSASAGRPTTSSSTAPASSGSTTRSSAISRSTYEALDLPGDRGQWMLVYTAEPGTPSHDAMRLLASWATTPAAAAAARRRRPLSRDRDPASPTSITLEVRHA